VTGGSDARHRAREIPPVVAASAALLEIILLVLMRFHANVAGLPLVGTGFSSRPGLPAWIPRVAGPGYDGQFFLRLALDPFDLAHRAFGIAFDVPYRAARIGYPFLAWALAFGRAHAVVWTLALLEVLSAACIAACVSLLLPRTRATGLYAVGAALYQGYAYSYGRDLAEPVAASLALLGIVAIERWHRPALATLFFFVAAATLETELIVVGAYGLHWLGRSIRRGRPDPRLLITILPTIGWAILSTIASHAAGGNAASSDLAANLGVPGLTQLHALRDHLGLSLENLEWLGQVALLVGTVLLAGARLRRSSAPQPIKILFIAMIGLALAMGTANWDPENGQRQLDLLWLSALLVIGSIEQPPRWLPLLGVLSWVLTAVPLVH